MFVVVSHFHPSLIFSGKAGHKAELHSSGELLALSANSRQGWKLPILIKELAYYATQWITTVKGFMTEAQGSVL